MATAAIAFGIIGAVSAVASTVVSLRQMKKAKKQSYTYGEGALTTSTSNMTPVPIIYGEVKVAGNQIYSRLANKDKTIYKLVVLAEGPIQDISDFQIDDRPWNSKKYKKVSYNSYLGSPNGDIDSRVLGSTNAERAEKVGGLKNLAYIAMQADANENLSSSFSISALVKGSLVRKYTSLEEYIVSYSNNPAWCILDFMTRYNGCGMSYDEIDIQSFIDAAEYFDNPDHKYTLNLILDEQKSRLEWINDMMDCCRSNLVYKSGKYAIQVEKAEQVVQRYAPEDIHDLQIWFSPLDEVPDIYKVTYIDPENEWSKVQAEASNPPSTYLRKQPQESEITLMGVTNFSQASRLAWFYLNQAITCQTYVEFKTDQRALNRTVGDVIELTDYITEFENKKFRIVKIEDTQDESIKLTCREYNEEIYTEKESASSPVMNVTKLDDNRTPPTDIIYESNTQEYYVNDDGKIVSNINLTVSYDDFAYNAYFKVAYRKVGETEWSSAGIFETGVYTVTIPDMEVFASYEFRFQNVSVSRLVSEFTYSPTIYIRGSADTPPTPENFVAERAYGGIRLSWSKVNNCSYKLYEVTKDSEEFIVQTENTDYVYLTTEGEHTFALYSVNNLGFSSTKVTTTYSLSRPKATGVTAVNRFREIVEDVSRYDVIVTWTPPTSEYYKRAEVWYKTKAIGDTSTEFTGDWVLGGYGSNTVTIPQAIVGTEYLIAVCVQDEYGGADSPSNCPQLEHTVLKNVAVPTTPTNLSISYGNLPKVSWDMVTNADIAYYELRTNQNFGNATGLLIKTSEISAEVPLTSRSGNLYLYAVSTSQQKSTAAKLTYNKAVPSAPTITVTVGSSGNVSLVVNSIPSNCIGIYYELASSRFSYDKLSENLTTVLNVNAGVYTVTARYKDCFGLGTASSKTCTVNPWVDGALIAEGAVTLAKLDEATKSAVENAVSSDEVASIAEGAATSAIEDYDWTASDGVLKDFYKVTDAQTYIGNAISTSETKLSGDISSAVSTSETKLAGQISSAVSASETKLNGNISSAISTSETKLGGQISSAISASETKLSGEISSAISTSEAKLGKEISDSETALNKAIGDLGTQVTNDLKNYVKTENLDGQVKTTMANVGLYDNSKKELKVYTKSETADAISTTLVSKGLTDSTGTTNVYTKSETASQISSALSSYDPTTKLSNYYTKSETASQITTSLNGYVTSSNLTNTLKSYSTTSQTSSAISTALGSYYTKDDITGAEGVLKDYYNKTETASEISTALGSYDPTSKLGNYYTKSETANQISSSLTGYVTNSNLTNTLKSYSTTSQTSSAISTALGSYYTKNDLTGADGVLKDYYNKTETASEISTALGSYDPTSKLTDYYTKSETSSAITTSLTGYAKTKDVTDTLKNYYNKTETASEISTALGSYDPTSKLGNYYTKSETSSQISSALTDYVTDGSLTNTLKGYSTTSQTSSAISTALGSYYTKNDLTGTNGVLKNYYNKTETASEISTALGNYDPTGKLGNYYTKSETANQISTTLSSKGLTNSDGTRNVYTKTETADKISQTLSDFTYEDLGTVKNGYASGNVGATITFSSSGQWVSNYDNPLAVKEGEVFEVTVGASTTTSAQFGVMFTDANNKVVARFIPLKGNSAEILKDTVTVPSGAVKMVVSSKRATSTSPDNRLVRKLGDFSNFSTVEQTSNSISQSLATYTTNTLDTKLAGYATNAKVDGVSSSINTTLQSYATKTYADGVASTAESNAKGALDSYKETVSTTYATKQSVTDLGGTVSTNLATAKTYAETQASAAEKNAKDHADDILDAYKETVSTTYATQASVTELGGTVSTNLATAKTYAESQASSALDSAKTYAESQASSALSSAKTYAESQASSAKSGAEKTASDALSAYKTTVSSTYATKQSVTDQGTEISSIATALNKKSDGTYTSVDSRITTALSTAQGYASTAVSNYDTNTVQKTYATIANLNATDASVSTIVSNLNKDSGKSGYSAITQLDNAIGLCVKDADLTGQEVVSRINLSPNTVSIDGKYVHITGDTVFDDDVTIKGHMTSGSISCDDGVSISGGAVTINGNGMRVVNGVGDSVIFDDSGMRFVDANNNQYSSNGRMVIGQAEHNQRVVFSNAWSSVPYVLVMPQKFQTSYVGYSETNLETICNAVDITKNGFNIQCYSRLTAGSSGGGNSITIGSVTPAKFPSNTKVSGTKTYLIDTKTINVAAGATHATIPISVTYNAPYDIGSSGDPELGDYHTVYSSRGSSYVLFEVLINGSVVKSYSTPTVTTVPNPVLNTGNFELTFNSGDTIQIRATLYVTYNKTYYGSQIDNQGSATATVEKYAFDIGDGSSYIVGTGTATFIALESLNANYSLQ